MHQFITDKRQWSSIKTFDQLGLWQLSCYKLDDVQFIAVSFVLKACQIKSWLLKCLYYLLNSLDKDIEIAFFCYLHVACQTVRNMHLSVSHQDIDKMQYAMSSTWGFWEKKHNLNDSMRIIWSNFTEVEQIQWDPFCFQWLNVFISIHMEEIHSKILS